MFVQTASRMAPVARTAVSTAFIYLFCIPYLGLVDKNLRNFVSFANSDRKIYSMLQIQLDRTHEIRNNTAS